MALPAHRARCTLEQDVFCTSTRGFGADAGGRPQVNVYNADVNRYLKGIRAGPAQMRRAGNRPGTAALTADP